MGKRPFQQLRIKTMWNTATEEFDKTCKHCGWYTCLCHTEYWKNNDKKQNFSGKVGRPRKTVRLSLSVGKQRKSRYV